MKYTVFYSWQSDLPNSTNRGFIESALEKAIKQVKTNGDLHVEPVIDRDTLGIPGSPDIVETIFRKIAYSHIFVCDVSLINQGAISRLTPNPNVLLELGYALHALSEKRILMVFNTCYGEIQDLPFDLRLKKVIAYKLAEEASNKAEIRNQLATRLAYEIRTITTTFYEANFGESILLPEAEEKFFPSNNYKRITFPEIILTDSQRKWLEITFKHFEQGKIIEPHVIRRQYKDFFLEDFDPSSIDKRLITENNQITLLGILHVRPDTDIIPKADIFIKYVRKIISRHPTVNRLSTSLMSSMINLSIEDISLILHLVPGNYFKSTAGNHWTNHYVHLCLTLEVGNEETFCKYEMYSSMDSVLQNYYDLHDEGGWPRKP